MTQQNVIGRLDKHQSAAFSATAGTLPNPISPQVYKIRVVTSAAAYIKIGNNPTATAADVYVPANWPEQFIVSPGQSVSAIQVTAAGTLHVTEIA
jgi:hypothetical protein